MSPRGLSFADAVRILDGDSAGVRSFGQWAGAAAGAMTVGSVGTVDFFALRNEVVRWGNAAVRGWREKVHGLSRFERTERLAAAHSVIVLVAFFEAFDRLVPEAPRLTAAEQVAIGNSSPAADSYADMVLALTETPIPHPSPQSPFETLQVEMERYYVRLAGATANVLSVGPADVHDLAREARSRYATAYLRLAADVPEFRLWSEAVGRQATRDLIRSAIAALHDQNAAVAGVRASLSRRYETRLGRPILSSADAPDDVVIPTLRQGYIEPAGLAATAGPSDLPATEQWWDGRSHVPDVHSFLLSCLTTPQATDQPLVVLGLPGSGKSVLTRVLAARLTTAGFLPIRVELRSVRADAPVQRQIEAALYRLLGETVSWPDVVRNADSALPVVMMDGFDELLQATGQNWTDYLERLQDFQRREAELGRPLAIVVTSRTAVADRARFPADTVVVRLHTFTDDQITAWLRTWNGLNAAGLAARGLQPLATDVILAHRELATQPLLLLLLALYDSRANRLRAVTGGLGRVDLYEKLFTDFFERQVDKFDNARDQQQRQEAVGTEWRRLSAVATAMFNRGRDVILETELEADVAHLLRDEDRTSGTGNAGSRPLSAGQLLIGRFFFVHEYRVLRDVTGPEHSFEFLHATFGEFLAARQIVTALTELSQDRAALRRRPGATLDAGFFAALTSFATITRRAPLWEFCQGFVTRLSPEVRQTCLALVRELFADSGRPHPTWTVADYEPELRTMAERQAVFSANLLALAVLLSDGPVNTADLVGDPVEVNWRRHALLWMGQVGPEDARGLWQALRVEWDLRSDPATLNVRHEDGSDVRVLTALPWPPDRRPAGGQEQPFRGDIGVRSDSHAGRLLRRSAFVQTSFDAREIIYAMVPFWSRFGDIGFFDPGGRWHSDARILAELTLGGLVDPGDRHRWSDYVVLLSNDDARMRELALTQLTRESRVLPPSLLQRIVTAVMPYQDSAVIRHGLADLLIEVLRPEDVHSSLVEVLVGFDSADQKRLQEALRITRNDDRG